ncbi:MAG: amidohydrolase family protein, partial [Clostridia bacterium]
NPLLLAATAASRTSKKGASITPDQAISAHEALRAITIDAAWQQMRETELGSIEIGKFADFTILKEDPYAVEPYRIKDIEVVTTYLAGVDTDTM